VKNKIICKRAGSTSAKVFLALSISCILVWVYMVTAGHRPPAHRIVCVSRLKTIALALDQYAKEHGTLPPAYTTDASGKPLHSWRTLILPYLEQNVLYDSIDLTKPWDDPVNATALATPLPDYQCPAASLSGNLTTYLAVVAPNSCLRPKDPIKLADLSDGASRTLAVVEVDSEHAVPWMSPTDADESLVLTLVEPNTKTPHPAGVIGAFAGCNVELIRKGTPAEQIRAMISIAGNDKVDASKEK
jgi:hypothetical protein